MKDGGRKLGITFSNDELVSFEAYRRLLLEGNKITNLTAITDDEGMVIKHFLDSVAPCLVCGFCDGMNVIDVGSGPGLPGIPLKIHVPSLKLTLLDSIKKKTNFLKSCCHELGLHDVAVVQGRAEEFGRKEGFRGSYDRVVARAVKPLNVLVELCIPFLKIGGFFLALKGPSIDEEIEATLEGLEVIGGRIIEKFHYVLPSEAGERCILVIEKVKETPSSYPRRPGIPEKRPL